MVRSFRAFVSAEVTFGAGRVFRQVPRTLAFEVPGHRQGRCPSLGSCFGSARAVGFALAGELAFPVFRRRRRGRAAARWQACRFGGGPAARSWAAAFVRGASAPRSMEVVAGRSQEGVSLRRCARWWPWCRSEAVVVLRCSNRTKTGAIVDAGSASVLAVESDRRRCSLCRGVSALVRRGGEVGSRTRRRFGGGAKEAGPAVVSYRLRFGALGREPRRRGVRGRDFGFGRKPLSSRVLQWSSLSCFGTAEGPLAVVSFRGV